jgi:4-alpha-glucanotransferase
MNKLSVPGGNQPLPPELPQSIRFGREICGDLAQAERREWWLSNGLGAYAAGTVAGTLTRRYHGLLIAPVYPPLGRHLLFTKADATLLEGERAWPLHSNRWSGGAIAPAGHVHIESFHLDGRIPVWCFAVQGIRLEQRIWMEPAAHVTYVAFRRLPDALEEERRLQLQLRLLVNARDHHHASGAHWFHPTVTGDDSQWRVTPPAGFTLHFGIEGGRLQPDTAWIENFDLPLERERGLEDRDSHLSIGQALFDLKPGVWVGIVASLGEAVSTDLSAALVRRRTHDRNLLAQARRQTELRDAPPWIEQLVLAADSFIFARPLEQEPEGQSVIAGYPWFGDWGRDTMIALPGLTLSTGRHDTARRILETFARFVDRGMLPNVFPGHGETPDYNTVDAALWYFQAWRAYVEASGDRAALQRVFPVLEDMIRWHREGTRYGIGVDPADHLLRAGEAGVQLTWMDAKVGDWVVTPRQGKPVEINALWYNALAIMAEFAEMLGHSASEYRQWAAQVRQSFPRFINPQGGLIDVLEGPEGHDATLRPNQIFAVSLPHSPLEPEMQRQVVELCRHELLCSYGLRSLAPRHGDYRPRYLGGVWERDGAYHQGPLWAWLLGHYALAEYRVHGDAAAALGHLEPLRDHLSDAALGNISEIFDGDPPHTPRGAPAQAWSVACTLEAWGRLRQAAVRGEAPRRSSSTTAAAP